MDTDRYTIPDDVADALGAVADVLTNHRVSFALIGGIAATLRGRMRFTKDVDLLLAVPQIQLPGLLDELIAKGFACDATETIRAWVRHGMVVLTFRGVRIDWIKPVLPLYQHVLDSAKPETWHGREIRVATAEGLILLKLIAARTQDLADIEALLAANRGQLDLTWIEAEWQTVFPTDDPRWQRFRQAVAEYYEMPAASP